MSGAGSGSVAARGVSWEAGGRALLDRVTLEAGAGALVALLGPNGSGKSSLLRLLAGLRRPAAGAVLLDGVPLAARRRRDVARRLAVVEQEASTDVDLRVSDVVALGRIPHRGSGGDDELAVAAALRAVGLEALAGRRFATLSGGERQRAQIARALAQEPTELLLDEPTNHLDVRHQHELMELLARIEATVVVALHDLNLAAAWCDRLVLLDGGRIAASGTAADVLTPTTVEAVYGMSCRVERDERGRPFVRYLSGRL